jgi:hypothetical protein
MVERDDIGDDDVVHGHYTTSTNALNGATDEKLSETVGETANQCPDSEKERTQKKQETPTKIIGQRNDKGLKDRAGEKI